MNFELTQDQQSIRQMVREFAQTDLLPSVRERDENSQFPLEAFRKLGETGLYGLPYPTELGGLSGSYLSYILAVEEVSKVDAAFGIAFSVDTSLYGGSIANSSAPAEIKKKFLAPITYGQKIGSFGLTEHSAGSDAAGQQTVAVKDGDSYILNGSKCFNTNGPLADYTVIYCLTDPALGTKGMAAFVVEKGTPGFTVGKVENKMGIRSAQVSDMILDNVRVPAENMIAQPGEGFKLAMKTLDGGRIGVAAQALGIAKGAFEITRKYMMEREQFGKPISKQQYLAFKMAELQTDIQGAELLLYKAAMDKEEGRPYTVSAAMAKMTCSNVAMKMTTEAVQLLGGNGYMKDYHVERMMRDAKITQIYEGTNEIQKLVISGQLFRK
ncbi:acyl-CoA dehydrogenase family protein [Intestinimonas massiliensis (ex Afouda et al. 2020)]|uniref:acyl-CoA dehydrogenase family protein n=1 Tax=Intestinimonas massiliensis (ex Afouda et al. 2020) TaxID=1673721 RepID=UPI0010309F57|nr:acyl-CoA dehydrogenase family protein [Intestinimonas massiliensis (ex Afouda et al. 2020)]